MKSIVGLRILGTEHKISNYADDTNFFLKDFRAVGEIFQIYSTFKLASGATLNENKTKILLLGKTDLSLWAPGKFKNNLVSELKLYGL